MIDLSREQLIQRNDYAQVEELDGFNMRDNKYFEEERPSDTVLSDYKAKKR